MSSAAEANLSENENTCVVCFKNVEIYSVGVCDHPVCYECSTRMRVLCRQNECPICRQDMPKVIFTKEIDLFSTLKPKVERMNLQDVKFGLLFCSGSIQQAYHRLLEHKCHLCSNERRWPFKNFQQLKDHMRKEHELFYCDLCVANVKIFTFERRCYNRSELAMHRRRGDIDNTSHRGHPLCEFCDTRYMDPDELFRHLRRDHYYCHFCDADGKNQYYPSYGDLRTHFLQEHYLCEEGDCKNEEFTSVFRTDIDLRAHVASTHSRHLSKSATKQARTLELEFTLAPRREQSNRGGRRPPRSERSGENEEGAVGYDNYYMEPGGNQTPRDSSVRPFVNSMSSNDFPSLGGACEVQARPPSVLLTSKITPNPFSGDEFPSLGSSTASQRSSNVTITTHGKDFSKISGNSRAPEVTITRTVRGPQKGVMNPQDFPALTSSANSTVRLSVSSNSSQDRPQSSRSNVSIHVNHQANGAITTKITTTPTSTNQVRPKTTEAFPALSNAPVREVQWVSQKPKRPPQEPKSAKVATAPVLPPSSLNDFPMLKGGKSDAKAKKRSSVTMPVSNTWVNLNSINSESRNAVASAKEESAAAVEEASKAKPKREAPKSTGKCVKKTEVKSEARVAERPTKVSEKPRTSESVSERLDGSAGDSDKGRSKKKRTKNNNDYKSSASTENFDDNAFNSKNADVDVNKNGIVKKLSHLKIDQLEPPINGSYHDFPTLGQKKPPPGFAVKPPPGFECANQSNMPVPNDLTFTNSSGQSFPILPASSYGYRAPPNFEVRNIKLADNFKSVLNGGDAVMEFINFSKLFRNGAYSAENYYEHCKHCLGGAFDRIFPELLVLLPDIEKQQDLYRLHTKDGARNDLDVCCTCNQVVFTRELRSHLSNHTLENNFPILPQSFEAVGNYWKK